jgi:hypothetical protein
MEPTVFRFILFLGLELLFIVASLFVMLPFMMNIIKNHTIKNEYATLIGLLATVISIVFMFLFMWILTGENYLWVFLVLAVISLILILIVELVWLIFSAGNVPWFGRIVWASYEFQKSVPNLNIFLQICAALILVVYPVYIGLGYFGSAFGGEDWPRYVLRSTIVVLVGMGWLTLLPQSLYLMISKNIMEDTRSRIFISQLANSVSILLFLSLFIWTIKGDGASIPLFGEYFLLSPIVGYAMFAYLLIILIIPYLIGHYRAKHWIQYLESNREDIIDKVLMDIMSPNLTKTVEKLEEKEMMIADRLKELRDDKAMQLADSIGSSSAPNDILYSLALTDSKKSDPIFIHYDNLVEVQSLIDECKQEFGKKIQDSDKYAFLNAYIVLFDHMKKNQKVPDSSVKPWVLICITSLVGSILNPIISSAAKFIVTKLGLPN